MGGGLFGSIIAIEFSRYFESVDLYEARESLLLGASKVNQARLHTGMHYPRSLDTAAQALADYRPFIGRYRGAVEVIDQHYGISIRNSKTSPKEFLAHADKLGIKYEEVDIASLLNPKVADLLIKVPEATFDHDRLRKLINGEIKSRPNIRVLLNSSVKSVREISSVKVKTELTDESYEKVVIAGYAQNSIIAREIDIKLPKYVQQLCEVAIVKAPKLNNTGITLMDGAFWSTMPFGLTSFHTLTNVSLTPHFESIGRTLDCQKSHGSCGIDHLEECSNCKYRPESKYLEMLEIFYEDTNRKFPMEYIRSMFTVKSVPLEDEYGPAKRPTDVFYSSSGNVAAVFSGKIGSSIHIFKDILARFHQKNLLSD